MKSRKATISDLKRMLEIEESAISGYGYLEENKEFYFDQKQNQGEMILALKNDFPVGMGQYSILPDGSGWLEILRVHQDYQHQGAGNAIYKRYLQLAEETSAPSVAMFTGRRNIASRALAEKNGFELACAQLEYKLPLQGITVTQNHSFKCIHDLEIAKELLKDMNQKWDEFTGINRTYFHTNEQLIDYFSKNNMIYSDGTNTVVLGCRMLKHRGWYIAYLSGNLDQCIPFAIQRTQMEQLPLLTISVPPKRTELITALEHYGFQFVSELIVMERKFKTLEKN